MHEWVLATQRLTIECVFSTLEQQMRVARTPRGLAQRITQRLLAFILDILIDTV